MKLQASIAILPIGTSYVSSSVLVIRKTRRLKVYRVANVSDFLSCGTDPQPDLVFLDELTTGLDAKARRGVWKTLKSLKEQGLTIFLTSHFMDEVEALCDEICILKKGTPVFRGTVEQAKQQCGCEHFEDAYLQLSDEEVDA